MGDESIHSLEDTVRVATGFVMGGFTTVYFGYGYLSIATLAAGIVFLEVIYGFVSVWYEAYQLHREKENSPETHSGTVEETSSTEDNPTSE